ncbi:MAG TPA: adenylate/guanylate cyclase domain-containing protein, partial [Saprospiraceae bacterium]|nr:adenylate/guanylate cyclase domain-containing protein [Saprospiraceae bacterium]
LPFPLPLSSQMIEHKESGRHLAAILFTDITGYTAMMQRDESLALASVRRHQEVLEREVPKHEGEIYQYYGDGSLSIFHSATQAVKCALEVQKALLQEPQVMLRIGLHIGEIYTEGGKIFGDAVNIASRIESIGQGGTVLFSRDVYEKIRNHGIFQAKSVGRFEFKNVEDPIEVFALTNAEILAYDIHHIEGKLKEEVRKKPSRLPYVLGALLLLIVAGGFFLRSTLGKESTDLPTKQSIAVLPFDNLSEGKEEDFLGTGIAEDILTQLAQIPDLKVISRSSSMRFKGYKQAGETLKSIAHDLKVTSILEGSIRKYNNDLRISVQLTNGQNENVIWADEFNRKFEDVLNVQRDVALAVSNKLKISLTPQLKNRLEDKTNVNPDAYINYRKGRDQLLRTSGTREELENALQYFEKSISIDSNFAPAWVGLSDAKNEEIFWHRASTDSVLNDARSAALHALQLDPHLGDAYGALGAVQYVEHNYKSAENNLRLALRYSPSYTLAYERLSWILMAKGQIDSALMLLDYAIGLDPFSTRLQGSFGNSMGLVGRYDEGIKRMNDYLKVSPQDNYLLWTLGFLYTRKGDYAKAIEYLTKRTIGLKTNWILGYCYAKTGQRDKAEEILNNNFEKKKKEPVPDFMIAVQLIGLGRDREAMDFLARGIDYQGELFFILALANDPFFETLHKYPEFNAYVKKLGDEFKRSYQEVQ